MAVFSHRLRLAGIALLVVFACGPEGVWTWERALAPTLARLDRDGDGSVGLEEYQAVLWEGPPFAVVDQDMDGALSAAELRIRNTSVTEPRAIRDRRNRSTCGSR